MVKAVAEEINLAEEKKGEQELSCSTRRLFLSHIFKPISRSEDQSLLEGLELAVERLHDARPAVSG